MAAKLKPEVARKYVFGTHHTVIIRKGQTINLCNLTLAEADALVAAGDFPYLVKKPVKPKASKK